MREINRLLWDSFPEGLIQVSGGLVADCNPMARHYLPQLQPGAPLPDCLALPASSPSGAGIFSTQLSCYTFSRTVSESEQLILFRPAPQSALTDLQLDGALRQMRAFLGELMGQIAPQTGGERRPLAGAGLSKSFHRMFRLVSNLDYMRASAAQEGVPFRPVTMDLAGLCRQLAQDAGGLLARAGTQLAYESDTLSVLISGDPQLLQKLLLELISNSVRAAPGGRIVLHLRRLGNRALLVCSDSGAPLGERELASMLQQDSDQNLPLPGQGAGLGLPIARHIVSLHQGTLLVEWGGGAPSVLVSLPAGRPEPRVSVQTPPPCRDGGLSPLMVELSDVLPAELFGLEGLD